MEVQVAMASSDGVYVNEHFGRARTFMIYRFTAGEWEHIETAKIALHVPVMNTAMTCWSKQPG